MIRPRRLRTQSAVRNLVRETRLHPHNFIYPVFVVPGQDIKKEIPTLEGQYHWSVDRLDEIIEQVSNAGIQGVLLFGVIESGKDHHGSQSYSESGVVQEAVKRIRSVSPSLCVMTDVCLCGYTDHGHCEVDSNDKTLEILGKIAVSHAKAGADFVAPSGMMDNMIEAMRMSLDEANFQRVGIMSYAVKYASHFYGPFRSAANSSVKAGDRNSYQMDPANAREAIKEASIDIEQSADIIMCKPGLPYLDIIHTLADTFDVPVAAYQVSGEYAMIKAAGKAGLIDADKVMFESLLALKRAGANIIITYAALSTVAFFH